MADKKITDLPAAAAFTLDMLFETVFDPAGAPISQKVTGTQVNAAFTAASGPPFVDTQTIIKGSADATKLLRFEIDGFTAGATRIATPPNQDFTIAGINVAQTFSVTQTFTPANNSRAINITAATLSAAASLEFLRVAGTWNTSGTPAAMLVDITDVGSNAASKLADFQISSASVFSIGKTGLLWFADGVRQVFNPNGTNAGINVGAHTVDPSAPVNGDLWYESTLNELHARINGATVALGAGGGASPPFDDGTAIIKGSGDPTKLFRIEVDGFTAATTRVATPPNQDFTMAGTNVAQTFTVEQTFTPAANTEAITVTGFSLTGANAQSILDLSGTWNTSGAPIGINLNITNTASDAGSFLMALRVGGAPKFSVNTNGDVASTGSFNVSSGNFIVASDGSFTASAGSFSVDASANITIFNTITFGSSSITIADDGASNLVLPVSCFIGTAPLADNAGNVQSATFEATTSFVLGAVSLTDVGTSFALSAGYTIRLGIAVVAGVIVPDSSIIIEDSSGVSYQIPCLQV